MGLEPRGNGQQAGLVAIGGLQGGDPGAAVGEGTGLVEGDGAQAAQVLQVSTALDQDPAPPGRNASAGTVSSRLSRTRRAVLGARSSRARMARRVRAKVNPSTPSAMA